MKRSIRRFLFACGLMIVLKPDPAGAQGHRNRVGRDTLFESEICARLSNINPAAVPHFKEATEALDADRLGQARSGFEAVLQLAPDFPDAERRLSQVELRLKNIESAISHGRRALALEPSATNKASLADILLESAFPMKCEEALPLALSAANELADDVYAQQVLLKAGVTCREASAIATAAERIVGLVPDAPWAHYYYGISLAQQERWEESERELLISRELGMAQSDVEEILSQGVRLHARMYRWGRRGLIIVGAWAVGLGALFLLGVVLSKVTLRAVARTQATGTFEIGSAERVVRGLYGLVIGITSTYFFMSIPVLFVLVLAAAGTFFWFFLKIGHIPVQLAAFVAIATLFTLYAIVRSVLARSKDVDPGRRLMREQAPELWKTTEEVANKVQTRPIQTIFITPGNDVAVMERGGAWRKLRGQGERCLILGLAAIPGLPLAAFKSILAHEYGHFSNRDTAGGTLANRTGRSMHYMVLSLASNGLARWYNPAWWFLRGFSIIFFRVTLGASRLQEILADRIAGLAYGAKNFISGLTHVIRQDLLFDLQLSKAMEQNPEAFSQIKNLYTLPSVDIGETREELESRVSKIVNSQSTVYDSHPAPGERFSLLEKLNLNDIHEADEREVSGLVPDVEALQNEMTAVIHKNIALNRLQTAGG